MERTTFQGDNEMFFQSRVSGPKTEQSLKKKYK